MLLGILNFIFDTQEAERVVSTLIEAVPSGSCVAITHPTLELGGEANREAMEFWNRSATPPITARTRAELAGFLAGLELVEPGIVSCSRWRPNELEVGTVADVPQFGAVARKP